VQAHFQGLVSVVKMATVLEDCTIESSVLLCIFCEQKKNNEKNIYKETFSVSGKRCLPRKSAHNWVEIFSQGRSKIAEVSIYVPSAFINS
jgi:hypothetical protein